MHGSCAHHWPRSWSPASAQVYAAGLYVEAAPAKAELHRLRDEGFFDPEGYTADRIMEALAAGRFRQAALRMDAPAARPPTQSRITGAGCPLLSSALRMSCGLGPTWVLAAHQGEAATGVEASSLKCRVCALPCRKLLHIEMLRSASVSQFDSELSKDLEPRLEATGDQCLLKPFLDYFNDKTFRVGTSLLSLWEGAVSERSSHHMDQVTSNGLSRCSLALSYAWQGLGASILLRSDCKSLSKDVGIDQKDRYEGQCCSTLRVPVAGYAVDGVLTGGLFPPGYENFAEAKVTIGLPSANFCRALFDMYIGTGIIIGQDARQQFADALLELLNG